MNKCPFCGGERVTWMNSENEVEVDLKGQPYYAMCQFYDDGTRGCGSEGPNCDTKEAAIRAFCHPAHLMKDKVLVKRETAQECLYRLEAVGLKYGGSPDGLAAFADLTTALEGK